MGQGKAVVLGNEFGADRFGVFVPENAVAVENRATGAAGHRPKDPAKEWVKRRIFSAMEVVERLAEEGRSGRDLRAALSKLDASSFSQRLASLAGMMRGGAKQVTEADMDRMEEALGWVSCHITDRTTQELVLNWARGKSWDGLIKADPLCRSQKTLWRVIDGALGVIAAALKERDYKMA